jgi:hypothetical protein
MADTFTTNLNLTKPELGAAEDTWGISLNADLDALDAIFSSSGTQINLNPNQVNFGDNKKAIFGAGSDLQIYHDGNDKIVSLSSYLVLESSNAIFRNNGGTEDYAKFIGNGAVELYHNNSKKFETTSTGITVHSNGNETYSVTLVSSGAYTQSYNQTTSAFEDLYTSSLNKIFKTGSSPAEAMRIDSNKNVGIGESSPLGKLHVKSADSGASADGSADELVIEGSGHSGLSILSGSSSYGTILFSDSESAAAGRLRYEHNNNALNFGTNGSWNRMYINSSGNVAIGDISPDTALHITRSNGSIIRLERNDTSIAANDVYGGIEFEGQDTDASSAGVRGKILGIAEGATGEFALTFETADSNGSSTEALRIDSNQNVGIGTSSPASKLSIENTGSSTVDAITLDWEHLSTTTNIEQRIQWRFGDDATADTFLNAGYIGSGKQGSWQSGSERDSYLSFGTTNNNTQTEAMRLDSSGNLLVGVTSTTLTGGSLTLPNSGIIAFHDAAGNARNALQFVSGQLKHGAAGAGITSQTFHTSNVEAMRIDSNQNVGIGTSSPQNNSGRTTLTLSNSTNGGILEIFGASDTRQLLIYNTTGESRFETLSGGSEDLVFRPNGSEQMRVTSTGLGIGTTSPDSKLHVDNGVSSTSDWGNLGIISDFPINVANRIYTSYLLQDSEQFKGAGIGLAYDGTGYKMHFATASTTSSGISTQMTIDRNGSVGIGTTSPTSALTIAGEIPNSPTGDGVHLGLRVNYAQMQLNGSAGGIIDFSNSGVDHVGRILYDHTSDYMQFTTNGSEALRIDSNQNVGIGTSPAAKLDIYHGSANRLLFTTTGTDNFISSVNGANSAYTGVFLNGSVVKLGTGGSEAARIDGSGNLLVGKTSTDNTSNGFVLDANGTLKVVRSSEYLMQLNRTTTDGEILRFQKDGTSVGSIGTNGGRPYLVNGVDGGIHLSTDGYGRALLLPADQTGAPEDNLHYLGSSTYRWRDIYLSGSIDFNSAAVFTVNSAERARIDGSGNLLVGTTTVSLYNSSSEVGTRIGDGVLMVNRSANTPAYFNRLSTDGTIADFRKDGTSVGSIGTRSTGLVVGNGDVGLLFDAGVDRIFPESPSGGAGRDNAIDLGTSAARFKDIYATNGTIQTSDINEKQDIEDLTDAETRVAVAAKGLLKKYRWKSAVEEKGDDARIHFGIMAQDLQNAFTAEGLDAGDYGMFISTTWTNDDGVEQTRLGVRYNELLAFIIAVI